jgi:hypothetical protein
MYRSSACGWIICDLFLEPTVFNVVVVAVLGFGAVWIYRPMLTFRRNMMSPSAGVEDGGSMSPKRQHRHTKPHGPKTQDSNMLIITVRTSNIFNLECVSRIKSNTFSEYLFKTASFQLL